MGLIYVITNKVNGKQYVGQTMQSLQRRWQTHNSQAKDGDTRPICRAIRKYGRDNFDIDVIDCADSIDELNSLEVVHIAGFHTIAPNGYNLTTGGKHCTIHPDTIAKLSIINTGKIYSAETRAKIGNAHRGRIVTNAMREKISTSLKGNHNHLGHRHTEETRARISAKKTGFRHSEETKLRIGMSSRNRARKPCSQETREKIRATLLSKRLKQNE